MNHKGQKDIDILVGLHLSPKNMKQIVSNDSLALYWSLCIDVLAKEVEKKIHQNIKKLLHAIFYHHFNLQNVITNSFV